MASNKTPKKKVLILSFYDYAGSGYRYSEAVNRVGKYVATSLKFIPHRFNFPSNYCICNEKKCNPSKARMDIAQKLINDADILHFKGDDPVKHNFHGLKIPLEKPIVLTTAGSYFRRHLKGELKFMSKNKHPMNIMLQHTNARTVTTPDLNYPTFESEWLPFAFDTKKHKNLWLQNNHDIPLIGHSPTRRNKKGTDSIFLPAIKILKSKKIPHKVKIIEGESYKISLENKKNLTLFFDQCGFGFYGNSLVEAAQYGIPCIAWLSEIALKQMGEKNKELLPIYNIKRNSKNCANTMIKILESDIKKISRDTKKWVDMTHSYEAVGTKLTEIYDRILLNPGDKKKPTIKKNKFF